MQTPFNCQNISPRTYSGVRMHVSGASVVRCFFGEGIASGDKTRARLGGPQNPQNGKLKLNRGTNALFEVNEATTREMGEARLSETWSGRPGSNPLRPALRISSPTCPAGTRLVGRRGDQAEYTNVWCTASAPGRIVARQRTRWSDAYPASGMVLCHRNRKKWWPQREQR